MKATTKKTNIADMINGNKKLADEITRLQGLKKSIGQLFFADVENICDKKEKQTKLVCEYYKLNIENVTDFIEIEVNHKKLSKDIQKINKEFFADVNASTKKHRDLLLNLFRDKELLIKRYASHIGVNQNSKDAEEVYNIIFKNIVNFWN